MQERSHSSMDGLHGAVRSQLSMEASRVAWETRWEPRVREPKQTGPKPELTVQA